MVIGIFKVNVVGPRGGKKIKRYFVDEGNGKILIACRTKKYGFRQLARKYGHKIEKLKTYKGVCSPAELAMARVDMMRKAERGMIDAGI